MSMALCMCMQWMDNELIYRLRLCLQGKLGLIQLRKAWLVISRSFGNSDNGNCILCKQWNSIWSLDGTASGAFSRQGLWRLHKDCRKLPTIICRQDKPCFRRYLFFPLKCCIHEDRDRIEPLFR